MFHDKLITFVRSYRYIFLSPIKSRIPLNVIPVTGYIVRLLQVTYYIMFFSGLIGRSSCRYEGWKYYIISRQSSGSCRNYYIIIIANCDTYRYRYHEVKLNSRAKLFTHYQSMYYTLLSTVYVHDISLTLYHIMVLHCINRNNNSLT